MSQSGGSARALRPGEVVTQHNTPPIEITSDSDTPIEINSDEEQEGGKQAATRRSQRKSKVTVYYRVDGKPPATEADLEKDFVEASYMSKAAQVRFEHWQSLLLTWAKKNFYHQLDNWTRARPSMFRHDFMCCAKEMGKGHRGLRATALIEAGLPVALLATDCPTRLYTAVAGIPSPQVFQFPGGSRDKKFYTYGLEVGDGCLANGDYGKLSGQGNCIFHSFTIQFLKADGSFQRVKHCYVVAFVDIPIGTQMVVKGYEHDLPYPAIVGLA